MRVKALRSGSMLPRQRSEVLRSSGPSARFMRPVFHVPGSGALRGFAWYARSCSTRLVAASVIAGTRPSGSAVRLEDRVVSAGDVLLGAAPRAVFAPVERLALRVDLLDLGVGEEL